MSNFAPGLWSVRPGTFTVYAQHGRSLIKVADARQKLFTPECQARTAQLIAAAPDLLHALEELCLAPNKHRPDEYWEAARVAIAKAKGL
jgi:hypothetical protein